MPFGINLPPLPPPPIVKPPVVFLNEFYTGLPRITESIDGTFKGGGTLGAAYAGALLALAKNGIWFQRVAGNSAGAITASIIAAGYDANEIDYLFSPKSMNKKKPNNLPSILNPNEIDYRKFIDFPINASDINTETKRNNLIYYIVKGRILDAIRDTEINLPSTSKTVDAIVTKVLEKFPTKIGPVSKKIPGKTISVGPFGWKGVTVGPFNWTLPEENISFDSIEISITENQKKSIREAVVAALSLYPTRLSLGDLGFMNTEDLRAAFADKVIDMALNGDPRYLLFLNFAGDGGILKGDEFLKTMKKVMEAKLNRSPIRFKDLPLDLTVIAADITDHKMKIYSQTTTPEMEVAEAVRRSMSIPLIFEPRMEKGNEIVDGGLVENYPFWIHLINQNASDMSRVKIGFYLESEPESSIEWNCPQSSHRDLNIAANRSGSFIENFMDPSGSSSAKSSLIELKMFNRFANLQATRGEKTALHDYLIEYYKKRPDIKFHEIIIKLKGFFWLDFNIDNSTYNGMCCRGWESTIQLIKERALVPLNSLVSNNPYKG